MITIKGEVYWLWVAYELYINKEVSINAYF